MSTSIGGFIAITNRREMISAQLESHIGRSTSLSRQRLNSLSKSERAWVENEMAVAEAQSNFSSSSTYRIMPSWKTSVQNRIFWKGESYSSPTMALATFPTPDWIGGSRF